MIDFIGIGAQKSGTSWAYTCLYEHPQICAPIKEINFFSRPRFEKGRQWYENHFNKCNAGKLKGEFSTSYLYSKETPERIHDMYPDVKLIAILRNPVDRAYSQYRNSIKAGHIPDTMPFELFMEKEESVVGQGYYAEQIERYLSLFRKEQLLIMIYEDIQKDPQIFMQNIYRFLGVSDDFTASMLNTEINIARTPKLVAIDRVMHHISEFLRSIGLDKLVHNIRRSGLPDLIRAHNTKEEKDIVFDRKKLTHLFADDIQKLSKMIDRDLNQEWNIYA